MSSAAFFGHRRFGYSEYRDKIAAIVEELIENCGVTDFYNGFRGEFDRLCAEIVFGLMRKYPFLKNHMVLSYHPNKEFVLPQWFSDSLYLLEKSVLPKYAISYTNQCIVQKAEYIVSGVMLHSGGAWAACEYARRQKKKIICIFETP